MVDSSELRAKHDVSFVNADLVNDTLDIPEADVILCNNLLFHFDEASAEQLVEAMVKHLAVGGIMSFGANAKQVRMSGNRDDTDYPEWRRRIAQKLQAQGIEAVLYDTARKAPFVFRRVS
ncbi:MAG TPA: CheR family methyltransferase [Patescibacteria group bacterium]|nr:CheR family methyltransferase [Patescibacteria group bacterium]